MSSFEPAAHLMRELDLEVDLADEHARWVVFQAALERGHGDPAWGLLEQALKAEPDQVMATSAVLRVLELVDSDEHARWLDTLASGNRSYAEARSSDIRTLTRATSEPFLGPDELDVDGWTDWLQLRAARQSPDPTLLQLLASAGRTKRIRQTAGERLREVRSST